MGFLDHLTAAGRRDLRLRTLVGNVQHAAVAAPEFGRKLTETYALAVEDFSDVETTNHLREYGAMYGLDMQTQDDEIARATGRLGAYTARLQLADIYMLTLMDDANAQPPLDARTALDMLLSNSWALSHEVYADLYSVTQIKAAFAATALSHPDVANIPALQKVHQKIATEMQGFGIRQRDEEIVLRPVEGR